MGITRAKDLLTLTCVRSRTLRGRSTPQSASPFISELGQESVTVVDLTTPADSQSFRSPARPGRFHSDSEERALIEAQFDRARGKTPRTDEPDWHVGDTGAAFPPEYEGLTVGRKVRHPKFGIGKVIRLRQPWPETRAEILFEQAGPKTIVIARTTLEVL